MLYLHSLVLQHVNTSKMFSASVTVMEQLGAGAWRQGQPNTVVILIQLGRMKYQMT